MPYHASLPILLETLGTVLDLRQYLVTQELNIITIRYHGPIPQPDDPIIQTVLTIPHHTMRVEMVCGLLIGKMYHDNMKLKLAPMDEGMATVANTFHFVKAKLEPFILGEWKLSFNGSFNRYLVRLKRDHQMHVPPPDPYFNYMTQPMPTFVATKDLKPFEIEFFFPQPLYYALMWDPYLLGGFLWYLLIKEGIEE